MLIKGVNVSVGDLVHIWWEDHYGVSNGGWSSHKKVELDRLICETVGWIVKMDKERIATVQAQDGQLPTPHVSAAYSVCPKRMISAIKIIKKNKRIKW